MATNRDPVLDPDEIANRDFATSFRGYDPHEVRHYLRGIAEATRGDTSQSNEHQEAVQALIAERDQLRRKVSQLERSAATAENDDAIHVTSLITSETTQVIESARAAASEIIRKAETEASRRRKEVKELEQRVDAEIQEKRSAVAEDTARIRRETQAEVTKLRTEADDETKSLRAKADEYASTTRAQAQEILRSRTAEAESFYETRTRKTEETTAAMRAEAEEETATLRRNAEDASAKMRREAEEETLALRRRTDEEVKALRSKAEAEAEDLRTAAQARVDELNVEADKIAAESENAANIARAEATAAADLATREVRDEARMMVAEARAVREKILTDLVRRRRAARQQIDQARAARDRLLRSLEEVKRELDEATNELHRAVPEARAAMDRVPALSADDDAEVIAAIASLDRTRPERARSFADLGEVAETEDYARRLAGDDTGDISEVDHVHQDEPEPFEEPAEPAAAQDGESRARGAEMPGRVAESEAGEPGTDVLTADTEPDADAAVDTPAVAGAEELESGTDVDTEDQSAEDDPEQVEADRTRLFDTADDRSEDPRPQRSAGLFGLGKTSPARETPDSSAPLFGKTPAAEEEEPEAPSVDLVDQRAEVCEELAPGLKRQLKRALADDQSELLDAVSRGGKSASVEDLPAADRQVARFADALESSLRSAATGGATAVGGRIWPGLVDGLVADTARLLVDSVRGVVVEAVHRDGGEDRSLEAIRSHYRDIRSNRLNHLVDSALVEAFDLGAENGAESVG